MAKIRIDGVFNEGSNYTAHVALIESQMVEGVEAEMPLGEAFVNFPSGTEMADVKKKIIKAAEGIWKSHQDALDKRKDIEELEFPPIPGE